jgi:lipoyl(octanoyl) transferase
MLLEHPPIYTGGTSAQDSDLLANTGIESVSTGRGGQWTYHGPGQRIIWPVLDLTKRAQDVRLYVYQLEGWMIDVLASFGIEGLRREGLPGIWVQRRDIGLSDRLDKIVAIGVRISRWVTSHGMAFNLDPELSHYDGIVPCGVTDGGVTSLADLGLIISQAELDMAIQDCFAAHFGPDSPLAIRS